MSDTSQGPGWWQASDGKWYPPEQAPGYQPPADGGAAGGGGGAVGGGGVTGGGGAPTLDLGAALGYGWNKFVQYIGTIIVIVLIIFAVEIVFNVVSRVILATVDSFFIFFFLYFIFLAVGFFLTFLLQAGLIRVGLAITRGEAPEASMLFDTDHLGPFALASILVAALVFVGFFFCCIGALVVALFTLFYGYYVLDKDEGPTASIGSSFNLVKDNFGMVVLFAFIVVILNVVTCGLAVGVTQIAVAYAYRTLNGEPVSA